MRLRMLKIPALSEKKKDFGGIFLFTMAIFIILIVLAKIEISDQIPIYATHMGHAGEEQFIYNLSDTDVIEQEFESPKDFDMISLHFSDHDTSIKGKTIISIYEKTTGNLVYYEEKDNSEISFGKLVELNYEDTGKKEESYILHLSFEGMGEKGLGLYGFKISDEETGAVINGQTSEYKVAIGTHTYTNIYGRLVILILVMLGLTLLISMVLIFWTKVKEEYLFLGIALPIGIAFLLFLSINSVHDGATHLAKVYHYSNVILGYGDQDQTGKVSLSNGEAEAFDEFYAELHRENNIAGIYYDTVTQFGKESKTENRVLSHDYRETSASSIFEYFPGVIGITIGRVLGGSVRGNILLAKLIYFAFYVIMIFGAIRIAPGFKNVIAFTGLLPMGLYQATGLTYDSLVLAIGLMIFAIYLRAREDRLTLQHIVLLFGLSYILGCCKGGFYIPLLLLLLTIPRQCVGSLKTKLMFSLGSVFCGCAGILTTSFRAYYSLLCEMTRTNELAATINEASNSISVVPETQIAAYGISYAFGNIYEFIKMMIITITQKTDQYIGSLVGYRMAWTDSLVSWTIISVFLILIILATSNTESWKANFKGFEKIMAICLVIAEIVGFHILMLVETPMGANIIEGVQGRYFLVWVPVIMMIFAGRSRNYEEKGMRSLYYYYSLAEVFFMYSFLKIFLGLA